MIVFDVVGKRAAELFNDETKKDNYITYAFFWTLFMVIAALVIALLSLIGTQTWFHFFTVFALSFLFCEVVAQIAVFCVFMLSDGFEDL